MSEEKIEIVYTKAKVGRRMLAHFIDIGIFLFSAIILFTLSNVIVTNTNFYKGKQVELETMQNESGLYIDGNSILNAVQNEQVYPTYFDRKNALGNALENFYTDITYFTSDFPELSNYRDRQLAAQDNNVPLFINDGGVVKENPGYNNDEGWYNFYYAEIDDHAMAFLVKNEKYFNLTRFNFLVGVIQAAVMGTVSFTIFYLILPLTCFKRGRQTIGMKLEHIGLINIHTNNLSNGVYVGRFFFMLAIFIYLDFFSFLIPAIVSVTMMFVNKTNSSLVNYIFNDYMVDITNQKIYFSDAEREEASFNLQSMSIENPDLTLK